MATDYNLPPIPAPLQPPKKPIANMTPPPGGFNWSPDAWPKKKLAEEGQSFLRKVLPYAAIAAIAVYLFRKKGS